MADVLRLFAEKVIDDPAIAQFIVDLNETHARELAAARSGTPSELQAQLDEQKQITADATAQLVRVQRDLSDTQRMLPSMIAGAIATEKDSAQHEADEARQARVVVEAQLAAEHIAHVETQAQLEATRIALSAAERELAAERAASQGVSTELATLRATPPQTITIAPSPSPHIVPVKADGPPPEYDVTVTGRDSNERIRKLRIARAGG